MQAWSLMPPVFPHASAMPMGGRWALAAGTAHAAHEPPHFFVELGPAFGPSGTVLQMAPAWPAAWGRASAAAG